MVPEDHQIEIDESSSEPFGEFLKRRREATGKSLDAVSRTTRIPKRYLHAFEENESQEFPDEAFTRGFLRAYAVEIGLDVDETLARYDRFRRSLIPTQIREVRKPNRELFLGVETEKSSRESLAIWGIVGGVLIIIAVAGTIFWMNGKHKAEVAAESESSVEIAESTSVTEGADTGRSALAVPVAPSTLSIHAERDGKLSVRLDDNPSTEVQMKKGDSQIYNVAREIEIRSSDRTAFSFQYNGKPLEVQGPVIKLFNRNLFLKKP